MKSAHNKTVCLWQKVRDELVEEIAARALKAGDRFLSLQEVCRRFKVSVITARRVFGELHKEGWIVSRPFKGTFVKGRARPADVLLFVPDQFLYFMNAEQVLVGGVEMDVVAGILAAARSAPARVCVQPVSACADTLRGRNLIFASHFTGSAWPERLREHNRVVCVNFHSAVPGVATVRMNMVAGAKMATRHLARLGHRRIALLTHAIANPWLCGRFDGYARALKGAGIAWDWELVGETFSEEENVVWGVMDHWLRLKRPPTAVFVTNDVKALQVLSYCRQRRIRVPRDLSIVGFDNIAGSAVSRPPLTTVDTQRQRLGRLALELILKQPGRSLPARDIQVRPALVRRATTARPAASE